MAKTKKIRATTNNITKAIIDEILHAGYSASRINVQGQFDEKLGAGTWWEPGKKGRWRGSGSRKGFYDIACCIEGRAVVIDTKNKKTGDELGADQITFRNEWIKAGGIAFEAESWQHFLDWWNGSMKENISIWKGCDRLYDIVCSPTPIGLHKTAPAPESGK